MGRRMDRLRGVAPLGKRGKRSSRTMTKGKRETRAFLLVDRGIRKVNGEKRE